MTRKERAEQILIPKLPEQIIEELESDMANGGRNV